MTTSSIIKNFIVSGSEQVEMFANAIEESYQESLIRPKSKIKYREIKADELNELIKKK